MWNYLALLLIVAITTPLSEARSRRSVGSLTIRATQGIDAEGRTEDIRLDCRPALTVTNVLMAVLIHLERLDENGTTSLVASKRINSLKVAENNRTSADGYLQADTSNKDSFLSVRIAKPIPEDDGIYLCHFAFIDVALTVHVLASQVNVTVKDLPVPDNITTSKCDCPDVWVEIDKLKAALEARPVQTVTITKPVTITQPVQQVQQFDEKCRVSFSARFSKRHGYEIIDDTVAIFDHIISNKGEAYDSTTGVFSAPCDGQYFVTVSLRSDQALDSGNVEGVIVVDNKPKVRTFVNMRLPEYNSQSAATGVVLTLKSGQKVAVLVKTTSSGEIIGDDYSVFSGFFLFP